MGTVGLSFGSPTSGQGFDVASTVNQLVTNLQAIETPWKTQLSTLQSEDTALTSIGTDLSSLSTALQSLTSFQGVLSEKQGSSSDTSVLQLTGAASSAIAGSHAITVASLAQTSSQYSNAVASGDTLSGTLSIGVGSGAAQTITIDPSNNTLATLADAINSGSYGVTANVITTSGGELLSLVSNTSGAGGNITLGGSLLDATTSSAVGFAQGQAGQDARLTVDGVAITSPSNTVTSAIQGVTIQLLSAAPTTNVQVEITNNNNDVITALNSFVTAYNKVIGDVNSQEGKTSSGAAEPLFGNPAVATIQESLQSAVSFLQAGNGISSITDLGLTANSDGTLSLNTDTLNNALNSNFQAVVGFFQPNATATTFGANLSSVLDNLGNSAPYGAVYLTLQQDASQESSLNTSVSNEDARIDTEKAQLTAELNQANYVLEQIPSELSQVNEIYSAITGYNQNPNH
ncbi:MAG: flagellar filament capping protein FliD [Silvibacterium sp.]|nr:flagellar filament capping protein FliD [Silvibacterium sp.]